jgi:hypothetical protein
MPRRRFQLDIASMMIVVVVSALMALGMARPPFFAIAAPATIWGVQLIARRQIRARCRDEGREPGRDDWKQAHEMSLWLGVPIAGLYGLAVMVWRFAVR